MPSLIPAFVRPAILLGEIFGSVKNCHAWHSRLAPLIVKQDQHLVFRTFSANKASEPMADEKPKPQIFAIMRNGHEVIRGGMVDCKEAIDSDDIDMFQSSWEKLVKFESMHKTMEEGNGTDDSPKGFFKVLDEKAGEIVTNEGLYNLHKELLHLEESVSNGIKVGDLDELKLVFPKFMEVNEAHLKKEEDVMMPSIQKMMMEKQPLKKFMCEEILPTVSGSVDWEFFIKYANEILEKHHGGMPRVRVFDHALWAAATPEEWALWSTWIEETLKEETYNELLAVLE